MQFKHAVVAGTFDRLHLGHQQLLTTTLNSAEKVSCGLTTKKMTVQKPLSPLIQSFSRRRQTLAQFLRQSSSSVSIFPLNNPLGSAPTDAQFDAIIASTLTKKNVNLINRLRVKNHLSPLNTVFVDLVPATDRQDLSSTRIRQGQIDRQGFAFHQLFSSSKPLKLPPNLKPSLQQPFDTLLKGSQNHLGWAGLKAQTIIRSTKPTFTIAVGDIAVLTFLKQRLPLNLAVIDLKTQRQTVFKHPRHLGLDTLRIHKVSNPASHLTPDLINALQLSFSSLLSSPNTTHTILVNGEEDLAVIPAILLSPLNSAIFYGQPHCGLVYIKVTETTKRKAHALINQFT